MTISQSRAPFERGSKLVRKTVLTDSRFPGTTELLSPASVELKGVRANLEEQVRTRDCLCASLHKSVGIEQKRWYRSVRTTVYV